MKVKTFHNSILQSCSYIIEDITYKYVYMIDCGDSEQLIDYIGSKMLAGIYFTHGHYDHVYGINEILDCYPETPVYCHPLLLEHIKDIEVSKAYRYLDDDFYDKYEKNFHFIDENSYISIFGEPLKIQYIPGHDKDCLCFQLGNYIFTGDCYNPDFPQFTDWPGSDIKIAEENEIKLKRYIKENHLIIKPGHYL